MADILSEAKDRERDAEEYYSEEESRMLEDFKFSNPADPQQWDQSDILLRQGAEGGPRPCITEDYTNQYIAQVENDGRQNKPGIEVSPGDGQGDKRTALELEGVIRQIEYASRADIAYATSLSHAARGGRGWIRVGTKMVNPALNEQEIRIFQVPDALSVRTDRDSMEPDGSDAVWGFCYVDLTTAAFRKRFGKEAALESWGDGGRDVGSGDNRKLRLAGHYWLAKKKEDWLNMALPDGSQRQILADDREREEQQFSEQNPGYQLRLIHDYKLETDQCMYALMSGAEVLEEPVKFPSKYIPLVPVYGHVLWIDGKRYVCGLSRQLRDSQRMKNFERSAWVEWLAMQPRAPWAVSVESIEGHEAAWKNANRSNAAFLPYNAYDVDGNQLPAPQRTAPPVGGQAFAQGSQMATEAMQGSVGMYRSNFGAPSNAVSGKAKLADQREGDTATYHFQDNRSRSIAHVGIICLDILPRIVDQPREMRSLSISGAAKIIKLDPGSQQPYADGRGSDGPTINISQGKYAVRVSTGPAYNSLRQEAAENLNEILGRSPQLMSVIGPYWADMQKGPQSDLLKRLLMTIASPAVQQIMNENNKLPPEAQPIVANLQQQLEQAGQQMQAMQQALQQAQAELANKQASDQAALMTAQANTQKADSDAQYKAGELALKDRELGLKERDMALREMEAQRSGLPDGSEAAAAIDADIEARKVDISAYEAETNRIKVLQEGAFKERELGIREQEMQRTVSVKEAGAAMQAIEQVQNQENREVDRQDQLVNRVEDREHAVDDREASRSAEMERLQAANEAKADKPSPPAK